MRTPVRGLLLLLLAATLVSGCNAIPITIPDPAAAPDSAAYTPPDGGEVGGLDLGSADVPPSNGPDGAGPVPVWDGGALDGPALTGDALPDAIDDGLAPPDGGMDSAPLEGGALDGTQTLDSLTLDSLLPDAGVPDTLADTDSTPSPDL